MFEVAQKRQACFQLPRSC